MAGGRGTYLILPERLERVKVGEFLGLVPGKIFGSFNDFKGAAVNERKMYHREPQHIHFPSGKILELCNLTTKRKFPFGLNTDDDN